MTELKDLTNNQLLQVFFCFYMLFQTIAGVLIAYSAIKYIALLRANFCQQGFGFFFVGFNFV